MTWRPIDPVRAHPGRTAPRVPTSRHPVPTTRPGVSRGGGCRCWPAPAAAPSARRTGWPSRRAAAQAAWRTDARHDHMLNRAGGAHRRRPGGQRGRANCSPLTAIELRRRRSPSRHRRFPFAPSARRSFSSVTDRRRRAVGRRATFAPDAALTGISSAAIDVPRVAARRPRLLSWASLSSVAGIRSPPPDPTGADRLLGADRPARIERLPSPADRSWTSRTRRSGSRTPTSRWTPRTRPQRWRWVTLIVLLVPAATCCPTVPVTALTVRQNGVELSVTGADLPLRR